MKILGSVLVLVLSTNLVTSFMIDSLHFPGRSRAFALKRGKGKEMEEQKLAQSLSEKNVQSIDISEKSQGSTKTETDPDDRRATNNAYAALKASGWKQQEAEHKRVMPASRNVPGLKQRMAEAHHKRVSEINFDGLSQAGKNARREGRKTSRSSLHPRATEVKFDGNAGGALWERADEVVFENEGENGDDILTGNDDGWKRGLTDKRTSSNKASEILIRNARVSYSECAMDEDNRLDCGYVGIQVEECKSRGCCWAEATQPGVSWCYHSAAKATMPCQDSMSAREECGYYGIQDEECVELGCCWMPTNEDGKPWCFKQIGGTPDRGDCGIPRNPPAVRARIVGGTNASPNSWPWQVSLQNYDFAFCGGSVINSQWVVTAAHCLPGLGEGEQGAQVVLGMHNLNGGDDTVVKRYATEIIPHENYDGGTVDNDIMLLKLNEPVTFDAAVSPVCLPLPGSRSVPHGETCYTTGWGHTQAGGEAAEILQQVRVPIIGSDICRQPDWYGEALTDHMICAGYREGGKDSCQGDSGGPFVCSVNGAWVLTGVVSWGHGCAGPTKPGIYTDVVDYIGWIDEKMARYS